MKTSTKLFIFFITISIFVSCSKSDDNPVANNLTLQFNNTFKGTAIVLGDATSTAATVNSTSTGQVYHFSELKYVISNIRLVKVDGSEVPYQINNLDEGATVIDQAKPQTWNYILSNIPAGEYKQIKFGLGVKTALNTLDEAKFPNFYKTAGANDTKMMWEWGTGYRFTKIEGFYDVDNKELSIHTGSTVEGTNNSPETYTQGVDAYRDIVLALPQNAEVGNVSPRITINADFDKLFNGRINTITLEPGNATPSIHTAVNMKAYVDNLGGDGLSNYTGIFAIGTVSN